MSIHLFLIKRFYLLPATTIPRTPILSFETDQEFFVLEVPEVSSVTSNVKSEIYYIPLLNLVVFSLYQNFPFFSDGGLRTIPQ